MLKLISTLTHILPIQKAFLKLHQNPHILYYHMVADKKHDYYYQPPVTADDFRFQIEWLKTNGYKFVPLSEIETRSDKKQVAITTDDGFIENYTRIAPILDEYNIPATFFLINNCIDNKDLMWMNKLLAIGNRTGIAQTKKRVYEILRDKKILSSDKRDLKSIFSSIPMNRKEEIVNELWATCELPALSDFLAEHKPYMNTHQINELLSAGFAIGGHTFSHPRCSELSLEELKHEVVDSIEQLKVKFDTPVNHFAYPFGLRPQKKEEEHIFHLSKATAFLGTKNSDLNLKNSLLWDRDKMEQNKMNSLFWFSVLPIVRKYMLRPMGVYK